MHRQQATPCITCWKYLSWKMYHMAMTTPEAQDIPLDGSSQSHMRSVSLKITRYWLWRASHWHHNMNKRSGCVWYAKQRSYEKAGMGCISSQPQVTENEESPTWKVSAGSIYAFDCEWLLSSDYDLVLIRWPCIYVLLDAMIFKVKMQCTALGWMEQSCKVVHWNIMSDLGCSALITVLRLKLVLSKFNLSE